MGPYLKQPQDKFKTYDDFLNSESIVDSQGNSPTARVQKGSIFDGNLLISNVPSIYATHAIMNTS